MRTVALMGMLAFLLTACGSGSPAQPSSTGEAAVSAAAAGSSGGLPATADTASKPQPSAAEGAVSATSSLSGGNLVAVKALFSSLGTASVPMWIAEDLGYFRSNGLAVSLSLAAGSAPTTALIGGSVDFISTSPASSVPAAVAGADIVILAGAANKSPLEIFSIPSITQPNQLAGKRLGITTFGSATDAAAGFAIAKWGLKDVAILQMGGVTQELAALKGGSIDAAVISDPTTLEAANAGFHRLARMRDLGQNVEHEVVAGRRSYIAGHKDVAARFVRAYSQAIQYFHTNRAGTLSVMEKYMKLDNKTLAASYDNYQEIIPTIPYVDMQGLQFVLDEVSKKDPRAKDVTPQDLVDMQFVQKLERDGMFK